MKEIIQKYPAPIEKEYYSTPKSEYIFDLHGATKIEAEHQLDWIFALTKARKYKCITIVTGKGTGTLFRFTQKYLAKYQHQFEIESWDWDKESSVAEVFMHSDMASSRV